MQQMFSDQIHLWPSAYWGQDRTLNQGYTGINGKPQLMENNNDIVVGLTSGAFEDVFCHEPSHNNTPPYGVTTPRQKNVTCQTMTNI